MEHPYESRIAFQCHTAGRMAKDAMTFLTNGITRDT